MQYKHCLIILRVTLGVNMETAAWHCQTVLSLSLAHKNLKNISNSMSISQLTV